MLTAFLIKLRSGQSLTVLEATTAMEIIMSGKSEDNQFEEYLALLADKGETADEIAGSAQVMQKSANRINPNVDNLVDIVGTGGDQSNTFNISTTTAFIVAGAGVPVAKHGNKAVSSQSGAANVLEALGAKIDLEPAKVERSIKEIGIGFLFAPKFHPAMKYAAPIRAKLKRRTIFNLLGPLTNPAGTQHELIGVFDEKLVKTFAEVLQKMGRKHAIIVHGEGLDELTTAGENTALELKDNKISKFQIDLMELGIEKASLDDLVGGKMEENAKITREILNSEKSPRRDIVLLNASAALVAADKVNDLKEGIALAKKSIDSGAAMRKLEELIEFSNSV